VIGAKVLPFALGSKQPLGLVFTTRGSSNQTTNQPAKIFSNTISKNEHQWCVQVQKDAKKTSQFRKWHRNTAKKDY
jgi:hypothetical protein